MNFRKIVQNTKKGMKRTERRKNYKPKPETLKSIK